MCACGSNHLRGRRPVGHLLAAAPATEDDVILVDDDHTTNNNEVGPSAAVALAAFRASSVLPFSRHCCLVYAAATAGAPAALLL